jgi:hypothetical protein
MDTKTKQHHGKTVEQADLDAFKANFKGQIIVPGDQAYDDARKAWNVNIDKRPAVIARCKGTADVTFRARSRPDRCRQGRRPQRCRPRRLRRRDCHRSVGYARWQCPHEGTWWGRGS